MQSILAPFFLLSDRHRLQPEKEKQNKSLTLLMKGSKLSPGHVSTDCVVETILQETQVQADSEPDIVKSTKSQHCHQRTTATVAQRITPPTILQPPAEPVAPPRRKKSRNLVCELSCPLVIEFLSDELCKYMYNC